jgi:hypothetical protein
MTKFLGLVQADTEAYMVNEEFTTTQAAPLAGTRVSEPGPGSLIIFDSTNKLSISGGKLLWPAQNSNPDPRLSYALSPFAGLGCYAKINMVSGRMYHGFFTTESGVTAEAANSYSNTAAFGHGASAAPSHTLDPITYGVDYESTVILGATRHKHFLGNKLIWVTRGTGLLATSQAGFRNPASLNGAVDTFKVLDYGKLDPNFSSEYGMATYFSSAVTLGQTFTHTADCFLDYIITTMPSAGSIDVKFRMQDSSNYWVSRVNSAGDIQLVEVIAGVENTRTNITGVITVAQRIVVIAAGALYRGFGQNVARYGYTSTGGFATATNAEVASLGTGGAIASLTTWPRDYTLPTLP